MIQNIGSISKQTEYSIYVSTEWLGVYCLIFYVNNAIALWSIFRKAGKPGWPGIIPIYNYIVLLSILDKPWWYLLLWFIPIVNVFIHAIVMCRLGDCFTRSGPFKLGLTFLPLIFLLILAFDESQYTAPPTIQSNFYQGENELS